MADTVYNPTLHSNTVVAYKVQDNTRVFIPDISNDVSKKGMLLQYDTEGILQTVGVQNILDSTIETNPPKFASGTSGM